jgi:ParB family transcriptional regulator, chromosome partitioning protein
MTDERRLGRGLSALFGEEAAPDGRDSSAAVRQLPVELLHPGRYQPRRNFDADNLAALVESIRAQGILQPLLVRPHPDLPDQYEIVAGERRWRAAQAAQLHEVPVVLRELGDREALEIAIVENVQRQDLSPLEEAEGYRRLLEEFAHTQEDLARAVGKSRSHIANMLRLLSLPPDVRQLLEEGKLTAGHARALLGVEDAAELAKEIVRHGMSVRQVERAAKARALRPGQAASLYGARDADTLALERELTQLLGLKVQVVFSGEGGMLTIHYRTLDQLEDVLRRLRATTTAPSAD